MSMTTTDVTAAHARIVADTRARADKARERAAQAHGVLTWTRNSSDNRGAVPRATHDFNLARLVHVAHERAHEAANHVTGRPSLLHIARAAEQSALLVERFVSEGLVTKARHESDALARSLETVKSSVRR